MTSPGCGATQLLGPAHPVRDPAVEADAVGGVVVGGVRQRVRAPDGPAAPGHPFGTFAERVAEREPRPPAGVEHGTQVRTRDLHRLGVHDRIGSGELAQLLDTRDALQVGTARVPARAGGRCRLGRDRHAGPRQEASGHGCHDDLAHEIGLSLLVGLVHRSTRPIRAHGSKVEPITAPVVKRADLERGASDARTRDLDRYAVMRCRECHVSDRLDGGRGERTAAADAYHGRCRSTGRSLGGDGVARALG